MKAIQFFALFLLLFSFNVKTIAASDEDGARIDKKMHPINDEVGLLSSTKVRYGNPNITIKMVFPTLITDNEGQIESVDAFNKEVDDLMKEEARQFKEHVLATNQEHLSGALARNTMQIDYDAGTINSKNNHIVSVRFSFQEYIGGMEHPKHYHRVLNFDMDTNRALSLSDIFKEDADYLQVLSEFSQKELSRHLQNSEMIEKGTAPEPDNFKNWNIKPEGLLITFDEYQVAPYVFGTQTVLIPYKFLKGMISKESPIADCLYGKHKCGRNNLLTGGFIDEAANSHHRRLNKSFG